MTTVTKPDITKKYQIYNDVHQCQKERERIWVHRKFTLCQKEPSMDLFLEILAHSDEVCSKAGDTLLSHLVWRIHHPAPHPQPYHVV